MSDTPRPQRRSRTLIILAGIILALFIVVLILFPWLKKRWTTPLGESLGLPTLISTSANIAQVQPTSPNIATVTAATGLPGKSDSPSPSIPVTPTTQPTATPEPLCGGPPVMTILAVGADNRDNTYLYGLGDVIRIVRVDFTVPKITSLALPRDLWVEIPGISDHYDITHGKLNQSYLYGGPGMGYYDGPGAGPGLMARTLDLNFGIRADNYGAANMSTFVKIVDALGGIDIYLPNDVDGTPIDDKTEDMGYFYAGQHHFNGTQALKFARIRKRYNDFTRQDFQNMVLCAVQDKLTSPDVITKLPKIIASFQGQVLTDLSPGQLAQMACLLPKLERENIIFTSLPEEILTPGRIYSPQQKDETYILEYDVQEVRQYVDQFMAGTWPTQPDEPTCK